jgi:hypothetical protein
MTGVDVTPYQWTADMTAYQPVGEYLTTGDSANFYTTANESGFITGVPDTYLQNTDLTISDGKVTEISGVPLSAGDELPETVSAATDYVIANSATINGTVETVSSNSGVWGGEALPLSSRDGIDLEISGDMLYIGASALTASIDEKLDSSVYATDSGSFLTAHQSLDSYLQNTDLEISDNKITGISGVPLAAGGGGDVPEGVMAESGLEYNAVDEISGYNGSAFAQYGAEKQWLVHDDTLVHAANSAQFALGVNLSAVAQLLGVDETVLWTNDNPSQVSANVTLTGTLSESCSEFEKIRFVCKGSCDTNENWICPFQFQEFAYNTANVLNQAGVYLPLRIGTTIYRDTCQISFNNTGFTANNGSRLQGLTAISENTTRGPYILKVIGIGRKS